MKEITKLFKETNKSYFTHLDKVLLFSVPLLVSILVLEIVAVPTFPAVGGVFLRIGSLPNLTPFQAGVMILGVLISIYFIALAVVSITLLIKSQKTRMNIRQEILKSTRTYVLNLFILYVIMMLIWSAVQLLTYNISHREIITPVLILLITLPFFYAPMALVIDNLPPERAVYNSVKHVYRKPLLFLIWLIVGSVLLTISTWIGYALPGDWGSYITLVINSLLIVPYLIILQIHMYLSKYSILG